MDGLPRDLVPMAFAQRTDMRYDAVPPARYASRFLSILLFGACLTITTAYAAGQLPEGDVQALLSSLARATESESKAFAISPAVYRFGRRSFELKNVRDMEIDGQGTTFVFALRGGRMRLQSCRNVTPKSLYLDMEHPPFIQGAHYHDKSA
jgi:hypothetical protein